MTICDYNVTMEGVKIAELKARLSHYLRRVRRGNALTVLDRETPIARIVPYTQEAATITIRPGTGRLSDLRLPPPLKVDVDIVQLLMEERQPHR